MEKKFVHSFVFLLFILPTPTPAQNGEPPITESAKKVQQIESLIKASDKAAVERLKPFLADEDWYVRGEAGRALGILGDKSTSSLLVPLLQDTNWFVREGAIEGLAKLGAAEVAAPLEQLFASGNSFEKARAADALGKIKDRSASDALIQGLSNEEATVKRAAARALGALAEKKAVPGLIQLLKDEDGSVRKAAALALGEIGDVSVAPLIEEAAKSSDESQWEYAAALFRLGNPGLLKRLTTALQSTYADARTGAFQALLQSGDSQVIPALIEFTKSPLLERQASVDARLAVADALALYKSGEGRGALLRLLDDDAPQVRIMAINSLVKISKEDEPAIRNREILPGLVNRLKKEQAQPVLEAINKALVNFDRNEAADLLLNTRDEHGKLKENVIEALNRIGVGVASLTEAVKKGSTDERLKAVQRLSLFHDAKSVEPLVSALSSDQELAVKIQAAESLGRLKDRRAVAPLLLASTAKEKDLRFAAVKALGAIGDTQAADGLFASVNDNDENVRQAAIEALAKLGISVDRLTSDLANPNWQTRVAALATMARLGDQRATPLAISALKDSDYRVRVEAARLSSILKDVRAVEPLIKSLSDVSADVRVQAAASLGYLGDSRSLSSLTNVLNDKDPRVSIAAAEALARMSDPRATGVLIKSLGDADWRTRARAAQVLARVASEKTDRDALIVPLTNALRDKDPLVRYYASEALTAIGAKAIPALINLLRSERDGERARASRLLSRIGKASVDALIAMIEEKAAPPETKVAATHALGLIGDERAIKPVAALLRDEHLPVRQQAAESLGQLGSGAIEQILEMANSSVPGTREAAMTALGGMRKPEAVARLLHALTDSNAGVRLAAVRALGETGSREVVTPLVNLLREENSTLRVPAANALARLGGIAVPGLLGLLRDTYPATRSLAIGALGDIGARAAVPQLLELLRTDTSGARGDAIEALGKIGDPGALEAILQVLKTGSLSVRKKCVSALSKYSDKRAVDALISSLSEPNEEVRQLAATGLGEIGDKSVIIHLERAARNDPNAEVRDAAVRAIEQLKIQGKAGK